MNTITSARRAILGLLSVAATAALTLATTGSSPVAATDLNICPQFGYDQNFIDETPANPYTIPVAQGAAIATLIVVEYSDDTPDLTVDGGGVDIAGDVVDIGDPATIVHIHLCKTHNIDGRSMTSSATDQADGDQSIEPAGGTIVDVVSYVGFDPGDYTMQGDLFDADTGATLNLTVFVDFTVLAGAPDGTVEVVFVVPAQADGTRIVALQQARNDAGDTIAEHFDFNDALQTVTAGVATTTTVAETTTTVAETTTTTAETTTTVAEATTTAVEATTTAVAVDPTTTVPNVALPETGTASGTTAWVALLFVALGGVMLIVRGPRRRHTA